MTRQRQIILEELRRCRSHPTADQLFETVRQRLPRISLGTVYRNLEILSDMGMVRKVETAGAPRRFDGDLEAHFHARCMECGAIHDLLPEHAAKVRVTLPACASFRITGYQLEFTGVCAECRRRQGHDQQRRSTVSEH
ncbi:MAG: transcriptional repressor [Acidobacteria bacterium]|nr:transcriptional repressor [Acidobacteriota bacterium]